MFEFNSKDFEYENQLTDLDSLLSFQNEKKIIVPPDFLFLMINYGEIRHKDTTRYYFKGGFNEPMLYKISSLDMLTLQYGYFWNEIINTNPNIKAGYLPILITYASNLFFLIGINQENLNKIFLYDDDYDDFNPILVAQDIFEFYKEHTIITHGN